MCLPQIAVIMGSKSDWPTMEGCTQTLTDFNLPFHVEVISAHRTPDRLFQFAEKAHASGFKVIIAGAGGAAHLPGMVACKTVLPVLGVPITTPALQGVDSLYSIVQMPKGTPVATLAIGSTGAVNAAFLAMQILAVSDKNIHARLIAWRQEQTAQILSNSDPRRS